jgi:hypothetical protein
MISFRNRVLHHCNAALRIHGIARCNFNNKIVSRGCADILSHPRDTILLLKPDGRRKHEEIRKGMAILRPSKKIIDDFGGIISAELPVNRHKHVIS